MISFYESEAKFKIPFEFSSLELIPHASGKVSLMQRNDTYPYRYFGGRILKKRDPLRSELQKLPFRFFVYKLEFRHGVMS